MKSLRELLVPDVDPYSFTSIGDGESLRDPAISLEEFIRWKANLEANITKLESQSVKVYRMEPQSNYGWYPDENSKNKYQEQALLICVEPIIKPVPIGEIIDALKNSYAPEMDRKNKKLAERIEKHGIASHGIQGE